MNSPEFLPEKFDAADLQIVDLLCGLANAEEDAVLREALTRLVRACAEGSLCLPLNESGLAAPDRYTAILGGASEPKPLILHRNRLYFHRHFHAEEKLAQGFLKKRAETVPVGIEAARKTLQEILETRPLRTSRTQRRLGAQGPEGNPEKEPSPIQLTKWQKWALAAALREKIFLLSGGPGTGKTTLTASLLRALTRLRGLKPDRIRLCAPTGRAAQRLQDSLRASLASLGPLPSEDPDARLMQIEAETLHHLLGYHPPSGRFARNSGDPLRADLVLLDEASMADAFTLSALVEALLPETTLILIGDADQLPAVESGSILSELLPKDRQSGLSPEAWKWIDECFPKDRDLVLGAAESLPPETVPTVILKGSHRAQESLQTLAEAIQEGKADALVQEFRLRNSEGSLATALSPALNAYSKALFLEERVQGRTYVEWLQTARDAPGDANILSALMQFLNRKRILTCARYGSLGCENVNALLQKKLGPLFEEPTHRLAAYFHGAPLLITRNDSATGLSNGEIGIWLRGPSGFAAYFQHGMEWRSFPAAFLPSWELAFATTVHKSQGSECDAVLLVLSEAGNRLLTREILYTAVTRARASVEIFGSDAALQESLNRQLLRFSGLKDYFEAGHVEDKKHLSI